MTESPRGGRLAALGALCLAGLALRLYGITAIGIGGSDTIYYHTLAEYWLAGHIQFSIGGGAQVFRPVLLAINALALAVFGQTDYAIKLGNVLLDGVNVLLVARIAWLLSRDALVMLAAAASYAFLPLAVFAARQELPHTSSTLFVLLMVLFLVRAAQRGEPRGQYGYLALAGTALGAAVLTHEELLLLGAPLGLCLLFAPPHRAGRPGVSRALARLGAFAAVPALCGVAVLAWQGAEVLPRLAAGFAGGGAGFYPEVFGRYLWDAVLGSQSAAAALACLAALVYLGRRAPGAAAGDARQRRWAAFCLLLPCAFVALYTPFFSTIFSRAFLPLVPLLLIGLWLTVGLWTARAPALPRGLFAGLLVALLVSSSLASYTAFAAGNRRYAQTWAAPVLPTPANLRAGFAEWLVDARYVPSYATHWGALHDVLDGRVDARNRVLVLPSTAMYSPGRRPLQTAAYFGDNAVYRVDHPELDLPALVARFDIRWVLFTTGQLRNPPRTLRRYRYARRWAPRERVDLARAYAMRQYSTEAEYRALGRFLAAARAEPALRFRAGSYEARAARIWRLPREGDALNAARR